MSAAASTELAFTAGLFATVNPCGFALLPTYLSYYLGDVDENADHSTASTATALLRAVAVGGALTAGFMVVFGVIGAVWSSIATQVGGRLPWVTAVMGLAVIALGIATLAGFQPTARLPKMHVGKGRRELRSTFVFGMSYAVASLSCTVPVFAGQMSLSFSAGFLSGVRVFLFYGLGMGSLITVLTIGVALAREGLVRSLRSLLPHMHRVSGALLVVTGAVVAYYGWAETRQLSGKDGGTGFASWLQDVQNTVTERLDSYGAVRIGLICGVVILGVLIPAAVLRSRRVQQPELINMEDSTNDLVQ